MLSKWLRSRVRDWLGLNDWRLLRGVLIELNDVHELRKLFGWDLDPILDDHTIFEFEGLLDVNTRRLRDAETLATIVRNVQPSVCLDIGTATGHSAALMAVNAPAAQVYTINIPPDEIEDGSAGVLTTVALPIEEIGSYYRERGLANITQIVANTAHWEPNIGAIDLVYVDGSHDRDFVYGDTLKVLPHLRAGGFILWHDFNPKLIENFGWIREVCAAVELLFAKRLLSGHILHVRDSWIGIFRVGGVV